MTKRSGPRFARTPCQRTWRPGGLRVLLSTLLLAASLTIAATAAAQAASPATPPQVSAGRLERVAWHQWIAVPERPIAVWLPPGYPAAAPYAVLYVHDGQMLFDGATTWNGL